MTTGRYWRVTWLLVLLGVLLGSRVAWGQVPFKSWDRSFGGNSVNNLFSLCQTADGGYLLGGSSSSDVTGTKTQPSRGGSDYWVVKLDGLGNKQWDRAFGGSGEDELLSLHPTADGGAILGGYSNSAVVSGDKTQPGRGGKDFWVVKLDAQGNKQWDQTFGGNLDDIIASVEPTTDGGYIAGGWSYSDAVGDKSEPNRGPTPSFSSFDYWVVKLTATGQKQWDRTLGGAAGDELRQVHQTPDGGYVLGGTSQSAISGDRTAFNRGGNDYWLVKLTATGNTQWDQAYGGVGGDNLRDITLTIDGGYALAGYSDSPVSGEKSQPAHPGTNRQDFWLVKVDAAGNKQWDRVLGGNDHDQAFSVQQTADGGYALAGVSYSAISGDKSEPNRGGADYWLVKLNNAGTKEWDRTYGGNTTDAGMAMRQTADGGYVLGGYSYSPISGDKTQSLQGVCDFWVLKLNRSVGVVPDVVRISGTAALCAGQSVTLTAIGSTIPVSYQWTTGAITASIVVTQPGTYAVTATFASGQTSTATFIVQAVAIVAPFTIGQDTTLCEGAEILLQGPVGPAYTYRWSDGSTEAQLRVRESGRYSLEVANACGVQTASRQVTYHSCITIPNIITPNGDHANDLFAPIGLLFGPWSLEVYNRWGRQVYRIEDYHNEWGMNAAAGLYYYRLVQSHSGITYRGWLEVVR